MKGSQAVGRLKRFVLVRHEHIYRYPTTIGTYHPATLAPDDLTVLFPCDPEVLVTSQLWSGEDERTILLNYLRAGEQLGLILDGDRAVSHGLVRRDGFLYTTAQRHVMRLNQNTIYIHCCATDPAYRGRSLYPRLLYEIVEHARAGNDRVEILIASNCDNVASCRGIAKAGFELDYSSWTVGFLGGRFAVRRSTRPSPAMNSDIRGKESAMSLTGRHSR